MEIILNDKRDEDFIKKFDAYELFRWFEDEMVDGCDDVMIILDRYDKTGSTNCYVSFVRQTDNFVIFIPDTSFFHSSSDDCLMGLAEKIIELNKGYSIPIANCHSRIEINFVIEIKANKK